MDAPTSGSRPASVQCPQEEKNQECLTAAGVKAHDVLHTDQLRPCISRGLLGLPYMVVANDILDQMSSVKNKAGTRTTRTLDNGVSQPNFQSSSRQRASNIPRGSQKWALDNHRGSSLAVSRQQSEHGHLPKAQASPLASGRGPSVLEKCVNDRFVDEHLASRIRTRSRNKFSSRACHQPEAYRKSLVPISS